MNKYIYLIKTAEEVGHEAFKTLVFDQLSPKLLSLSPAGLKIDIAVPDPPRLTILPLKHGPLAMVSLWASTDPSDSVAGQSESLGLVTAGYQVTESMPVKYDRDWPDGEPSPGIVMLTLMPRNLKLTQEQFMTEWFGHHTPLAMRIHPLWNYTRNVVESVIINGSPVFEGIVAEHFRRRRDVINPVRFFGGPLRMVPSMIRVGLHSRRFLHFAAIENYLLVEHHILSPAQEPLTSASSLS